jgi:hypothetical protein
MGMLKVWLTPYSPRLAHCTCNSMPCFVYRRATARQLADIAVNYLRDHPEQRHYVASADVALALASAFPCPN